MEAQSVSDINDVWAQELPPDSALPAEAPFNASDAITQGRPRAAVRGELNHYPPGVSGNPGGVPQEQAAGQRYTVTRALREALTVREAKRIADAAIEMAADGSIRHMEYVRDSLEGKPGVRIADGEWNPETAPTFNIMASYRTLVSQPQTPALPDAATADGERTAEEG